VAAAEVRPLAASPSPHSRPSVEAAAPAGRLAVRVPPPWLPRWRKHLLVAALGLLAAAVAVELWRFRSGTE
jgi:hypothetical protein